MGTDSSYSTSSTILPALHGKYVSSYNLGSVILPAIHGKRDGLSLSVLITVSYWQVSRQLAHLPWVDNYRSLEGPD